MGLTGFRAHSIWRRFGLMVFGPVLLTASLACAPAIELGPGSTGGEVAVNSVETEPIPQPYSAVNVHLHMALSAGVTGVTSVTVDEAASVLPAPLFCTDAVTPAGLPNDRVFGCVSLTSSSVTVGGLLATLAFGATGDGCITVSLVTSEGSATLDTYTVGGASAEPHANSVNTAAKRQVLVGAGGLPDCPA